MKVLLTLCLALLTLALSAQDFKGGTTGRAGDYETQEVEGQVGKLYPVKADSRYRTECMINYILETADGTDIWVVIDEADNLGQAALHHKQVVIEGRYYEHAPSDNMVGLQVTAGPDFSVTVDGVRRVFNPCKEDVIYVHRIRAK